MNIDNRLDALKKIERVDAPPFLYTRVRQAISNLANAPAPVQWRWAFAATGVVLILLNLAIVLQTKQVTPNKGLQEIVNVMQLSSSNDLYND